MCLPDCEVTGKRSYRSRGDALARVRWHLHRRASWTVAHRPYLCPECGRWHLTRKTRTADHISRKLRRQQDLRHRRHHDD